MEFRILGPLEIAEAGRPVPLAGGKPRAVLALLLLNGDRVVPVERLVDDLWGERPPETAPKMVQIYVSQLRKQLPAGVLRTRAPGYLLDLDGHALDLRRFETLSAEGREAHRAGRPAQAAETLRGALSLWRGPALAEFSEPFARLESDRLEELRLDCLEVRVEVDLELGRHRELVAELDALVSRHPHRERLRGQLMLALYRSGRHAEALGTYQAFRRLLADELGIDPPPGLRELERRVLQQDPALDPAPPRRAPAARAAAPARAATAPLPAPSPPADQVGRDRELGRLEQLLADVLTGERRMAFVTGEAGIGKTTIVERFLADVESSRPIRVARGQCVERRGAGEAHLPLLDALGRLLRQPGCERLVTLLVQRAPTWVAQMPWLLDDAELESVQRRLAGATHERMLREMVETLEALTSESPLVLLLEDLHWSDPSTIDLLEAVARRREPAQLLVLATYRRGDAIALDHPVHRLELSLRSRGLCAGIAVDGLDEDALERYAAARLGGDVPAGVGRLLRERTRGNPLFATTLLESWLEQGLVVGESVALDRLAVDVPDSVRELIEQMLVQLDPADQELLGAASVAGRRFSAAAVAAALGEDTADVEHRCAALARAGRFLEPSGEETWPDGTIASCFSFAHDLLHEVVYSRLPAARRARLHASIGSRLEAAYGERAREVAPRLADHFVGAGEAARAVTALRLAAEQSFERLAPREAVDHVETALEMLERLPEDEGRWAQELALRTMLGAGLISTRGWAHPGAEEAFLRARELAERLGRSDELGWTLFLLGTLYEVRGDYDSSEALLTESLALSGRTLSDGVLTDSHELLACSLFHQGSFERALDHADRGLAAYDGRYVNPVTAAYGDNAGAACHNWAALSLWFLGYPDRARERARQAVELTTDPQRRHGHATALALAAAVEQCCGDTGATLATAEAALRDATAEGYRYRVAMARILRGWAMSASGDHDEGVAELERGLELAATMGARMDDPYFFGLLGDAQLRAGRPDAAKDALAAALAAAPQGREFFYEPEIRRLQGEVALAAGEEPAAVLARFDEALDLARRQGARSLELRCALSAARLLASSERHAEARELVAEPYSWFTEGFETRDLVEARRLLDDNAQ